MLAVDNTIEILAPLFSIASILGAIYGCARSKAKNKQKALEEMRARAEKIAETAKIVDNVHRLHTGIKRGVCSKCNASHNRQAGICMRSRMKAGGGDYVCNGTIFSTQVFKPTFTQEEIDSEQLRNRYLEINRKKKKISIPLPIYRYPIYFINNGMSCDGERGK